MTTQAQLAVVYCYKISFFFHLGDCDFQNSFCGWYNTHVGDDFNWTLHKGSTSSLSTGPSKDRRGMTSGEGLVGFFYDFAATFYKMPLQRLYLMKSQVLLFYFFMF